MSGFFATLLSAFGSSGAAVDARKLKTILDTNPRTVVVDVRTPGEFSQGHVPNAVNMPLGSFTPDALSAHKDKDIYLICRSGARSGQAQRQLAAHYTVINVSGGTSAWQAAGFPTR
jgi:rhodanese-related sulfurtransferase